MVCAALLCAAGCSNDPSAGYTLRSQYVQDVRSVFVPIWHRGREVYRRGVEFRLTESIIKRIQLDTTYTVTEKDRADTELRGTIERISQMPLSYNPDTGRQREEEITMRITFSWTDLASGRVLASRTIEETGAYIPASPFGEDFFQGSEDVINKLARRVVEEMEADW